MKILIFVVLYVFNFLQTLSTSQVLFPCFAESFYYAKIETPSVYLYSSPVKSDKYRLFEIPDSYYVVLKGSENEDFFCAKYADINGYVLKTSVVPINETPNFPFANSSFRVFTSTNLYSSPSTDSSILSTLNLETITSYYGTVPGQELIPDSTNLWYYCAYNDGELTRYGYIYSYFCDKFQKIQPNTESYTKIEDEIFKANSAQEQSSLSEIPTLGKILIFVGISIPCLAILIIVLRKKSSREEKPKKLIRKPRKDFYEINDDI